MNKTFSLYLDVLRGVAAVVVVFYHYSNQFAQGIHSREFPQLGLESVMAFFVLSGFVIAFVVDQKEKTWIDFLLKRFARIYSVVIPAVLLAISCYLIVVLTVGDGVYPPDQSLSHFGFRLILNLSFLNFNVFFPRVILPGGGPYWSLTFEVWYYAIFFIVIYCKKYFALVFLPLITIFLGAGPILLLPVWLLGGFAYHLVSQSSINLDRRMSQILFVLSIAGVIVLNLSGLRDALGGLGGGMPFVFSPSYTKDFLYFYLVGLLICVNLVAAWSLSKFVAINNEQLIFCVRHLAGVSFSLYLFHLPLMRLFQAFFGDPFPYLMPFVIVAIVVLTCKPLESSNKQVYLFLRKLAERHGRRFGISL